MNINQILTYTLPFTNYLQDNSKQTQKRIQEAIDLYVLARKYPKKKKKQLKKKALADYNFWKSVEKWDNGHFIFN